MMPKKTRTTMTIILSNNYRGERLVEMFFLLMLLFAVLGTIEHHGGFGP